MPDTISKFNVLRASAVYAVFFRFFCFPGLIISVYWSMLLKWKIFWIGFGTLVLANAVTLFVLPFNRERTTGIYRGIPDDKMLSEVPLPENYILYYVNGTAYICQRGLYFGYSTGDVAPVIYNARKPQRAYNYTFLNFGLLVSIPFVFIHFIWFAFILKVYDPLMEPVFPRVKRTVNIDAYQKAPRARTSRQISDRSDNIDQELR